MDTVHQWAGDAGKLLQTVGQQLTSGYLLLQLGLLLLATVLATLAAILIRRRVDLTALTMGWPALVRQFIRHAMANLGTIIFLVLAVLMHAAMLALTWPSRSYLIGVAASLASAWVVIALVAGLIRNQFVYRLVSVSAWTIAALSILGLLQPAMNALDSGGVFVIDD